jgi:hypothetical protein
MSEIKLFPIDKGNGQELAAPADLRAPPYGRIRGK